MTTEAKQRTAVFVYKCRRCGRVFDGDTIPSPISESLRSFAGDAHARQVADGLIGHTLLKLDKTMWHDPCHDLTTNTHGIGVADLIGLRWEEKVEGTCPNGKQFGVTTEIVSVPATIGGMKGGKP